MTPSITLTITPQPWLQELIAICQSWNENKIEFWQSCRKRKRFCGILCGIMLPQFWQMLMMKAKRPEWQKLNCNGFSSPGDLFWSRSVLTLFFPIRVSLNSVTSKKSPNVYKSCPKMISLEKLKILTPLQKLCKNVGDLGKLIAAKGFKNLPKSNKSPNLVLLVDGDVEWVMIKFLRKDIFFVLFFSAKI